MDVNVFRKTVIVTLTFVIQIYYLKLFDAREKVLDKTLGER